MEIRLITHAQLRAARSLVGLSKDELATKAGITTKTLTRLESNTSGTRRANDVLRAVVVALEKSGVEFLSDSERSGVGVRFAKGSAVADGASGHTTI